MNVFFCMTLLYIYRIVGVMSVSLTPLETDLIGCLKPPEEVHVQCKNITVNGGYKYPSYEVCGLLQFYYVNQTVKYIGYDMALPVQEECLNRIMKCLRGSSEICKIFITDHSSSTDSDASSLSDPGKPKQQLNNTTEQTDMDSDHTSNKDQSTQPAAFWITVGGPVVAVVLVLVLAGAAWWCLRKKKQMETTEDGALPEETTEKPEEKSLLSGTDGPVTGDGTVTLTNDGSTLDGPRRCRLTSGCWTDLSDGKPVGMEILKIECEV